MKKSILSLGKALNKVDQKQIKGGTKLTASGKCDAIEGNVPFNCPCITNWCAPGMYCDTTQQSHLDGICVYN
ncbi:hypothetical protein [Tenacibaculum sediminilitoris]|uniref:hypothetical protein n=1 Tax=Tenacibaculum sediminilitoris TaxID=1820334 RepID=UPI0038B4315D